MSMKKMLAVVAASALAAAAVPAFAANPFSDVPMNHWAYDAVENLSAKGILEGYPDGAFKGNRAMTRYEIATMVARMMAAGGLSGEDLEQLKALVVEFQPELEALGVKVDGFDSRLSALEKGLGGWKLTGQMRFDYNAWDEDEAPTGAKADGFEMNRARLFMHRDLANGVSFDARYHTGKIDRFFVTAKDFMGVEGLTMKGGQFPLDWEDDDGLSNDNDDWFMDSNYRGFDMKYNRGAFTVEAFAGSNKGGDVAIQKNKSDEYYGARARFDFSEKFWLSVNGLWTNESDYNYDVYWAGLGFKFADGIELKGAYYMEDIADDSVIPHPSYYDDDPKGWKAILSVDQDVLQFTSLWLEYAHMDCGFILHNNPWAFSDIVWPDTIKDGYVPEMDIFFVKAQQKWNDKWSTIERFVRYDYDDDLGPGGDAKEWSVAVGYQYSPNLYFELAYADMDGRIKPDGSFDDNYDNNQIRFRTLLNF